MTHANQLDNLRFLYGEKIALSLPDLTVNAGKVTTLTGSNGYGKSTLLNLLAFMEAPDTGKITFFGKQVRAELNLVDSIWVNFKSNSVMAF